MVPSHRLIDVMEIDAARALATVVYINVHSFLALSYLWPYVIQLTNLTYTYEFIQQTILTFILLPRCSSFLV